MKTRELDLCVSCEICAAACALGAITMEYEFGQFLPRIDDEKCTKCGLCLDLCPGIDIDPLQLRYEEISDNVFDGPCLESYTAYSNDPNIRRNSASGGLITTLVAELLKDREFDAAFVLNFDKFDGNPARLKATSKIDEILSAAKSKYVPASVYNVIEALKEADEKRYIIVATPCQTYGIQTFVKENNMSEKNLLFLGLFCEKTLNFNIIRYFESTCKKAQENLVKFEFRTKEEFGWPGNSKMYFDSGRELIVDAKVRMQLKRFFQLNRCLFCLDKLNRLADISFGDCYTEEESDFDGKSSVMIRTGRGRQLFDKYSYLFSLKKADVEEIRKAQALMGKKDNLGYVKILIKENGICGNVVSNYEVDAQAVKKLRRLQRYIRWGKEYSTNKIKIALFLAKTANKASRLRAVTKKAIIMKKAIVGGSVILEGFLVYLRNKREPAQRKTAAGNVVIVGASFYNKGSQAMLFTAVDQIKRRFPDKDIYLFSTRDFKKTAIEKSVYRFKILPWDFIIAIRLLGFWNKLLVRNNEYDYLTGNIKEVVENADCFIDISGYSLSSQWGLISSVQYILNIIDAKKYSIPYYVLPQSIGPFDYSLGCKAILYPLLKLYLKYPRKIFVREKEGSIHVRKFSRKNVEKSYDIVLQNNGYDLANIYNENIRFEDVRIEPNSVGIVPNLRVIERTDPNGIYSLYNSLISKLVNARKTVYILRHSYEDLQVCQEIKSLFPDNRRVKLISDDLNAIELENIIKQFDFVIASRYHSIVHAYRNGVPALVIGWATKYFELLDDFDQADYFFDCRNSIDVNEIDDRLDEMIQNHKYERQKVTDKMHLIFKENVFDALAISIKENY